MNLQDARHLNNLELGICTAGSPNLTCTKRNWGDFESVRKLIRDGRMDGRAELCMAPAMCG